MICFTAKIVTVFLALFLTLLPENVSFNNFSQDPSICFEETEGLEEEAVIQAPAPSRRQPQLPSASVTFRPSAFYSYKSPYIPVICCFEKQWISVCRLRL